MATDRNDAAGYLGWFFLGGIIGAASALLLAPKAGREIRDQLLEHGGEFAKRAQELANDAQGRAGDRSEEHTSELQSQSNLVCRLLLEKKKTARAAQQPLGRP